MTSVWLILTAAGLLMFSGLPACLLHAKSTAAQRVTTFLMIAGSLLGLSAVTLVMSADEVPALALPWFLPWGQFAVRIDAISAVFLLPVLVVPMLGSFYGLGYWKQIEHSENGRWLGFFYGLLAGAMVLVVIAHDGAFFLFAWEIMALAAYFALSTEGEKPDVQRVSWIYLIATHMGTLCLFALFSLWFFATGSFTFQAGQTIAPGLANAIFLLTLVGFSFKAGLFPLHFWLPGAHANAPSHLSALMSGVLLKMGVYGFVRMTSLLGEPPIWWGGLMLVVGAITALLGILFAIEQHDFKRLLAYSSVENVGIIAMGLGLALLGKTLGQTAWIVLGLCGALLHVWNHSLFKSLLFLNAGAILHAVQTRQIDKLGGLAKRMPRTMLLFVIGAIAICALPPLNGFASEWLLYLGLFRTLGIDGDQSLPAAAVGAVALATVGALAVVCFVKFLGAVFLGSPRSDAVAHAHDPTFFMLAPMMLLACGCFCVGLFPLITMPLLQQATRCWAVIPASAEISVQALAPLSGITTWGLALIALSLVIFLLMKWLPRAKKIAKGITWDCGYAKPTARMQYTGSAFSQMLVDLLNWTIWPRRLRVLITDLFAKTSSFQMQTPDVVLDRGLEPVVEMVMNLLPWARRFQHGRIHAYILYVLAIVVFLFLFSSEF